MYTLLIYIEMSLFKNILFDVNININHSYGGDKMNDSLIYLLNVSELDVNNNNSIDFIDDVLLDLTSNGITFPLL